MKFDLSLCTKTCHLTFIDTLFSYLGVLIRHTPGESGISHHCSLSIKTDVFIVFLTLLEFLPLQTTQPVSLTLSLASLKDLCSKFYHWIPEICWIPSSPCLPGAAHLGLTYAQDIEAGWPRSISTAPSLFPKVNKWVCSS